ncbi:MAG: OmpA family protein [Litorimonas sp.]
MFSKWLGAGLLLAIASLILGWIFGMPKIESMEKDIRAALDSQGYESVQVDMSGNVATLSGEAMSESAKAGAIKVAENTECSACKNKRKWHVVKDAMTFKTIAVQNPYTFNAVKNLDGNVTVNGFVPSETAKADLLLAANRIFNTKVIDRKIRVASGAPDGDFLKVTESYMTELASLDKGTFSQEGYNGLLKGTASDVNVRDRINLAGQGLPAKYATGFRADINVPEIVVPEVGEIKSVSVCQKLFEEVKSDKRIQFETGAANIKGAESFDLLNTIASAANRCPSFRIEIGGHTDSTGDEGFNQRLSEARAATVKNYLSDQQVEANRLTAIGFGEANPRATNSTAAGRAQNRRITFTVTQAQ